MNEMTNCPRYMHLTELLGEIMEEAKSNSGTWKLATHTKLRDAVEEFGADDANRFVDAIMKTILSEQSDLTRFKLAQICTMLHCLKLPVFEGVFGNYETLLFLKYSSLEGDSELGRAAVRLLKSLFIDEVAKSRRTSSYQKPLPQVVPITMRVSPKTPDPQSPSII